MRFINATVPALLLVVLVMACSKPEPVQPLTTAPSYETIEAAQAAAGGSDKYIVVDFYTDW